MQVTIEGGASLKDWKKNCQPKILYSAKTSFKTGENIKYSMITLEQNYGLE